MSTAAVAVGTDGTEYSNAAVDWAAHEAQRRRRPLRIVHAFDWDRQQTRSPAGAEYADRARTFAEGIVATALDRARALAPDIAIRTDVLVGHAVPRLLEAAQDADRLVLGSRGRGGFAGLLLGSVSQRVATHAPGPVVVVRGRGGPAGGPIVAGVDDSPAADLVLDAAFTAAAEQQCPVTVVRAYLPVIPLWLVDVPAAAVETPEQDAQERAQLEEQLVPWRARFPAVPVGTVLTHEGASLALVEASRQARLIVVGSRGHGALAGALLGSASLQLLHHAACPVLITRPRPA
ncbi:universal stress protein [Amorphoplanes nipponensis]|uniref:Universal stress protein n=1 Tax=Actinoplanes nipponensis TaxID=135950 RepID=A0A919MRD6_9ACTN|nr:universal stress protein [Actinoplanes nipponensis]GIE54112.1 universal stress protein [Actinoplanes nipponensis]